jgi:hypothetical protein
MPWRIVIPNNTKATSNSVTVQSRCLNKRLRILCLKRELKQRCD